MSTTFLPAPALAADLDLTRAVVVTPPGQSGPAAKAVRMLVEEVETRSMVRWDRAEKWPVAGTPDHTVDRAADTAGSIVDKAAVVAGKAAARVVYSAYLH